LLKVAANVVKLVASERLLRRFEIIRAQRRQPLRPAQLLLRNPKRAQRCKNVLARHGLA